jgi:hypothetical protein
MTSFIVPLRVTDQETHRFGRVLRVVLPSLCDSIAALRRKIQVVGSDHVLFLDETAMRVSEAPTHTIVLPGESAYVVVDETTSYAKRFDMIACCSGKELLPPIIYSPSERADAGVKGVNNKMLVTYIQNVLAQACGALDRYPLYLVLDRATCHNEKNILEAFHDNGCQDVVEIWKMPTQAAKRMSPLDNSLFHDWKERVRRRAPIHESNIEQLMADEWNNLPPRLLHSHYKHCGLIRWQEPYSDCPQPSSHVHNT